jgi:S1-C subfamily serine protease
VVGTATVIAGHVAITARHVLEHALSTYGARWKTSASSDIREFEASFELKLYQVLPGPVYRIWKVSAVWWTSETDIAVLHLAPDPQRSDDGEIIWRTFRLRVLPPPIGQTVVAFGYRQGGVNVTQGDDGVHHIKLDDRSTRSIGIVREVYPSGRDAVRLPFPCFEIEARFDPGMSGGMVIDEAGNLCGLICASWQLSDPSASPISYVASLWPMLKTEISVNRGDRYPRDVSYPMIDLAIDGLIPVVDLHELDPTHFPGKRLTVRDLGDPAYFRF